MTTEPWSVEIDGMVDNPGTYSFEQLVDGMTMEERIYRLRCVERWSMVIPWNGFELADLLERVGVQSGASYVAFETLAMQRGDAGPARAHHRLALSRGSASG
jgi:sulfoxide reductase catalytic subunit YedY